MEILDIVNENDEVIGQALENEIYEKRHPHRIIHILIFNDQGEMALQLRSMAKPFCPGYWSTTVGGRVSAGETYEQAAKREFQEELNTLCDFEPLAKVFYTDKLNNKMFITSFKAIYNGPFVVNPEEVQKVKYFSLDKIKEMIDQGEKFHPELLFLLKSGLI